MEGGLSGWADIPDEQVTAQHADRQRQESQLRHLRREFEQTRGVTLLRMDLLTLESLRAHPRQAVVSADISADGIWHLEFKEVS